MSTSMSQPNNRFAELCARMQNEVDDILTGMSDKALFAEFREEEIVNIYNPAEKDIIRETLDERIIISPMAKRRADRKIEKQLRKQQSPSRVPAVIRRVPQAVKFLFTPFEL